MCPDGGEDLLGSGEDLLGSGGEGDPFLILCTFFLDLGDLVWDLVWE